MNYRDLQNISYLSQHILTESAYEEHDVMNRWPYTSPYLQEDRSGYGDDSKFRQDTDAASFRPGTDVPRVKKFGRISRAIPHGIGAHANRTASRVTTIVGDDPGAARAVKMPKETKETKTKTQRVVKRDGKWVKIKEDFALWMDSLLDEGYDLSDCTYDEMYDLYLDESRGQDLRMKYTGTKRTRKNSEGSHVGKAASKALKSGDTPAFLRYIDSRETIKHGRDPEGTRRSSRPGEDDDGNEKVGNAWRRRAGIPVDESYELYDLVLAHLIDEGYAETQESANAIMANMSEDWVDSIIEEFELNEGKKSLPVSRMAKQARRIAFSQGVEDHSDEGSSGPTRHSNPKKALATMSRIGGAKVKHHRKKGYEMGSQYDPYYQELNSRNPSRNPGY